MKKSSTTMKALSFIAAAIMLLSVGCSPKVNEDPADSSTDTSSSVSDADSNTTPDASVNPDGGDTTAAPDESTDGTTEADSSGEEDTKAPTQGPTKAPDVDKIPTDDSFKEPVYDLNGRTIYIASENDLAKDDFIKESVRFTEKKYHCKFKFKLNTDYFGLYETLINDHAAGDASYDVVELRGYDVYPNAATSGAILDLSSVYPFDKDPTWQNEAFKEVATFKGSFYGIPYAPNEMGTGLWYNKALFRKFGVKDPWEYVEEDKWNFNTFRTVCKKLTKDENSDGKVDFWALTAEDPWITFVTANGGSAFTMSANGPKYALNSKKALTGIEFANTLFTDNTVPDGKELGAITDSPFNAMTTGKVAMFPYHARYGAVLEAFNIPSADIGWVYLPKGPDASDYTTATITAPGMFVIPQDVKGAKELVAAVQDLAAYWDASRPIKRKVTDRTGLLYNALKTSLNGRAKEILNRQATKPEYTYIANYGIGTILQEKVWPEILGGKSPKTVLNSYANKIQSELTSRYRGTTVE